MESFILKSHSINYQEAVTMRPHVVESSKIYFVVAVGIGENDILL